MKSSGAPKTGKTTSKKLPMVTYLWGGICALAILMLLILLNKHQQLMGSTYQELKKKF